MKKNILLTGTAAILTAATVLCTMPASAFAEETVSTESSGTESVEVSVDSTESDGGPVTSLTNKQSAKLSSETAESLGITKVGDNVKLKSDEKPYLCLGADLSINQRETVLALMGIAADDLANYDATVIRNTEEHDYLDSYIDSSEIGTYALSSVVIVKTEEGSGLNVATFNVDYCTVGMYKNAMATVGITDADVIVAAPVEISGTAALVGIFKAYEDMTDTSLDSDITGAAVGEMVATGELLGQMKDEDSDVVEGIIAILKDKLSSGDLSDESAMITAIEEAGQEYGVNFDDEEVQEIVSLLKKLKKLDLDWDSIAECAQNMASDISSYSMENQNFFQKAIRIVSNFFNKLTKK